MLQKVNEGDADMIRVFESCTRTWAHLVPRTSAEITTVSRGRLIQVADTAADRLCPHRRFTFTIDVERFEDRKSVMLSAWENQP